MVDSGSSAIVVCIQYGTSGMYALVRIESHISKVFERRSIRVGAYSMFQ